MIEKMVTVQNRLGFHARAAAMFAKEAERFSSTVEVEKNGMRVNGKSIMGLLMIPAPFGTQIKIIVKGSDEEICAESLARFVESGFEEDGA